MLYWLRKDGEGKSMNNTNGKIRAILFALLAAAFYAVNVPVSKLLLGHIEPVMMAALLYLGAGLGIGAISLVGGKRDGAEKLDRKDLPYVLGMIVLDISAPIFLMLGIRYGTSASASLLGNFEIVATALVALAVFHETVSKRLWGAIALITLASAMLSLKGGERFVLSTGSLLVLLAATCWGFENNCTRMISSKSTYEIVVLKGVFSGFGSLVIALVRHESFPPPLYTAAALALGFVAYGLSIFLYVRAQSVLGAAKTSAYYSVAPFIGAFLSFLLLRENLSWLYFAALAVMLGGAALVVVDTLKRNHTHLHAHTFTHTHDGTTHTHTITHEHDHRHYLTDDRHGHRHSLAELERAAKHGTGA